MHITVGSTLLRYIYSKVETPPCLSEGCGEGSGGLSRGALKVKRMLGQGIWSNVD